MFWLANAAIPYQWEYAADRAATTPLQYLLLATKLYFIKGKISNYFFNESRSRFKASKIYSTAIVCEEEPSVRASYDNRQKRDWGRTGWNWCCIGRYVSANTTKERYPLGLNHSTECARYHHKTNSAAVFSTSCKVAGSIPDGSLTFFVDVILPAELSRWGRLSL